MYDMLSVANAPQSQQTDIIQNDSVVAFVNLQKVLTFIQRRHSSMRNNLF